jgi:hypothetical protein
MDAEKIRVCLKIIREPNTLPEMLLPNGKTASETAHEYVLDGKTKRTVTGGKRKKRSSAGKPANKRRRRGNTNSNVVPSD